MFKNDAVTSLSISQRSHEVKQPREEIQLLNNPVERLESNAGQALGRQGKLLMKVLGDCKETSQKSTEFRQRVFDQLRQVRIQTYAIIKCFRVESADWTRIELKTTPDQFC